jgi:hypothetical protein
MKTFSNTDLIKHDKVFRLISRINNRIHYLNSSLLYSEFNQDLSKINKMEEFQRKYTTYINHLVNNKNNYEHYLKILHDVNTWKDRKTHLYDMFGIKYDTFKNYNPNVQWILDTLKQSTYDSHFNNIKTRLHLEFIEKKSKNWFMVFSTLTVDANNYEKVFKKGSNYWRYYIQKFQRMIATDCYGSWRKAKNKDYFSYFAVVEQGDKTGRLHIHVVKFFKNCKNMSDPNSHLAIPDRKSIKEFEHLWECGYSQHVPIRWNETDAFGLLNWKWRVEENEDTQDYQPIVGTTIPKISQYLIKYVMKSKTTEIKKEVYSWKTKMSRKLGMKIIMQDLEKLTTKELQLLTAPRIYPVQIKMYEMIIPSKLIRQIAVKMLYQRQPKQEVLKTDTTLKMLLRSTIRKKQDHKLLNFGSLSLQLMKNKVTYNMNDFVDVVKKLSTRKYDSYVEHGTGANPIKTI